MRIPTLRLFTIPAALALTPVLPAEEWPHYASDATRSATANRAARDFDLVAWSVSPRVNEEFVWHSSPVVYGGRVVVNARLTSRESHASNLIIAYDVFDGTRLWDTPIEADEAESWSSPALDARNETVLIGSGYHLYALDLKTGDVAWELDLPQRVVNASPAVTVDLFNNDTPANRVFITEYQPFNPTPKLYAVNVDPNHPVDNPFEPGEIVWAATLPAASGNTPAYHDGVVYVSSVDGVVMAVDASDGSTIWETDVNDAGYSQYSGFYGGVSIQNGYVYAASYVFYGLSNNSGLFKFNAADGEIEWVVPCERSASIPIVTESGTVLLSGGIAGFGVAIKIQAFEDHGSYATQIWDTFVDTGETLEVGGWTHQPAYSRGYLYAGQPAPGGGFGAYARGYILDTEKGPPDPSFVVDSYEGSGGSPAVADGMVYSLGSGGLVAHRPSPACTADLNGDGLVSLSDLSTLLAAFGTVRGDAFYDSDADLNRDGQVDLSDLAGLLGVYEDSCL